MELPKYHKNKCINNWKKSGVIYHNFDDLYEVYINTMNCQHCNKEFPNSRYRHLDHDHETGMFRKIVCHKCNTKDSYINHPGGYQKNAWRSKNMDKVRNYDKYKYIRHKDKILAKQGEKIECECGVEIRRSGKAQHKKSMKHLDWFMNYVD
jgi:hypothetical protein